MPAFERRHPSRPWKAKIHIPGKTLYLGSFSIWSDAVRAEEQAKEYYGIKTRLKARV
jgi:hypothetical protein